MLKLKTQENFQKASHKSSFSCIIESFQLLCSSTVLSNLFTKLSLLQDLFKGRQHRFLLFTLFFVVVCPWGGYFSWQQKQECLVRTVQEAQTTLLLSLQKRYTLEVTALTRPQEASLGWKTCWALGSFNTVDRTSYMHLSHPISFLAEKKNQ